MKTISPSLQAHLQGELTTLAYLVKLTRADGTVMGFTTHDRALTVGGVSYKASGALTPSEIESRAGLAVDHLEVTGLLDDAGITDADVQAGLYDYARVDVYVCNWANLAQGVVQLRRGWLGQVTRGDAHYVAELRGLHDLLQRPVGAYYTPECRFDLGDASCGVSLSALTATGSVTTVLSAAHFTATSLTAASGTYNYGKLTWLTGANAGASVEVKDWDLTTQTVTLWLPMANAISTGDSYTICAGCDKKFTTCRNKFSNGANFGGFPHVPGVGNILKYPA